MLETIVNRQIIIKEEIKIKSRLRSNEYYKNNREQVITKNRIRQNTEKYKNYYKEYYKEYYNKNCERIKQYYRDKRKNKSN